MAFWWKCFANLGGHAQISLLMRMTRHSAILDKLFLDILYTLCCKSVIVAAGVIKNGCDETYMLVVTV